MVVSESSWEWVNHGVFIGWTPGLFQDRIDGSMLHHLKQLLREMVLDLLHKVQNSLQKMKLIIASRVSILRIQQKLTFGSPRRLWMMGKTDGSNTMHSQGIINTLK
jgi:hypothetical protein